MRSQIFYAFALLCCISGSIGKKGFGPGEQEWDYVEVRPNANMFWWLYFTTADVNSFYERPLIIWLQGGPGGSSTSFGNFGELGPLDVNLNPRNYTWVKNYNVLFIDNPVGTGFSHVSDGTSFARNNTQIARDLIKCMQAFYKKLPKFANVPTYITTESYGGKMGAEFARLWYLDQKAGDIKSNLKGIGLGDGWIAPMDFVNTWAEFLLQTGMVDTEGAKKIEAAAKMTQDKVDAGKWTEATQLWGYTERVIQQEAHNVDFYNILEKIKRSSSWFSMDLTPESAMHLDGETLYQNYAAVPTEELDRIMNDLVKKELGLFTRHGAQSSKVFEELMGDFMKPVVDQVATLLDSTDLKVFVYSGHLDLICDTPGTVKWVENMSWKGATAWKKAKRLPIIADNIIEGFVKSYDRFKMYWINRAGHMVPLDNPMAMDVILQDLTAD